MMTGRADELEDEKSHKDVERTDAELGDSGDKWMFEEWKTQRFD